MAAGVDTGIESYARRADELDIESALDLLIHMYQDNCGISLTERTIAENAIHFWISKWRQVNPEIPDMGLYKLMKIRSEEYRNNQSYYDRFDVTCLNEEDSLRYCHEIIDYYPDDNIRIAICAGLLHWLEIDI